MQRRQAESDPSKKRPQFANGCGRFCFYYRSFRLELLDLPAADQIISDRIPAVR